VLVLNKMLNKEQKKDLERLIEEINDEAKKVVEDYANNPTELSGSVLQVHSNSPFLKEKS
tara:strand:- start:1695 stop:1874 length:180 start_codon:yes stop_codon:yes gene_type:complete